MNSLAPLLKIGRSKWSAHVLLAVGVLTAYGATAEEAIKAEIRWTRFGIPHVEAENMEGLAYGYGYAVARDQLCLLADLIITVRGNRSRHFGPDGPAFAGYTPTTNINADIFHRVQLPDVAVASAGSKLSRDARALARGYAAGVNRFVREMPSADRPAECRDTNLPMMRDTDVIRIGMQVATIWPGTVVGTAGTASVWNRPADMPESAAGSATHSPLGGDYRTSLGSNSWAYGSRATATGSGLMVANPHSTWRGWLRMHVGHFVIPGKLDVFGADFLGWPLPLAGFNRDVAWSIQAPSTVTFFALYKLDVSGDETPTYTVDGRPEPLTFEKIKIGVKHADVVEEREYEVAKSRYGPVYKLPAAEGRPAGWYAVANAGLGNAGGLDQQIAMAQAQSVRDLRKAIIDNRGITAYFVAADRHGETLLAEAGNLPDIDNAFLERCAIDEAGKRARPPILDGGQSRCSIKDRDGSLRLAPPSSLPAIVSRGIVTNSNDSYRLSLFGEDLDGYSILLGDPTADPGVRARMSHRHLQEIMDDGRATPEETLDLVFANRSYAAETHMEAIAAACTLADATSAAARACATLSDWDRSFNPDSHGALVFSEAWPKIAKIPDLYEKPFDPAQPLAVRRVNRDEKTVDAMLEALETAQAKLDELGLRGDERWGRILSRETPDGRVGLHGGPGSAGVLNALHAHGLSKDGFEDIPAGPSYIQVVTWESGELSAKVLHVHGQSADPASPHYSDQFALYARKQLLRPPLTDQEIAADAQLETLVLSE